MRMSRAYFNISMLALLGLAASPLGDEGAVRLRPGEAVANLRGLDVFTGKEAALHAPENAPPATVLVFSSAKCPVAAVLAPRISEFIINYQKSGARFLFVNAQAGETAEAFAEFARKVNITENAWLDPGQKIADALGVATTSEVLVLDAKYQIAYRGAVDDQYIPGARKPEPKRYYLREALDAVLAGRQPAVKVTKAEGCRIGRERKDVRAANVNFNNNVAPILQKHCSSCHQPGEVGPMSLLNYQDAADMSLMIGEVVENGRMPPWHADARFGKWSNERRLSGAEKQTILDWVKAGAPKGDGPDITIPVTPPAEKSSWHIGAPDLVLHTPKQQIPAQGTIEYRYINIPTGLTEDRWVQAAEVHAGARQNVHHILVFCKYPKARKSEEPPIDGGLEGGFFASLVPGDMPNIWPAGTGKLLPAGSSLMFQIHYTANGVENSDVSEIGLRFCKEKPSKTVTTRGITQRKLRIAPGDPAAQYSASWFVPSNIEILALSPHMHYRGKSFQYEVRKDGKSEIILSVPKYDFNWQAVYRPAKPVIIEKGSTLKCSGEFDNSAANPANPNPAATVKFGEQSWEEMFIGYVDYIERD